MTKPDAGSQRLLIVGCGYVAEHFVHLARAAGQTIYALTRSEARFAHLKSIGVQPVLGHWLEPESLNRLPSVDGLLVSVPHRAEGAHVDEAAIDTHAVGLNNLLAAMPNGWSKLVYLSTTGVYGQDSSDLVNEDTPVSPTRIGPKMAVAGEQWLDNHLSAVRFTVLRLAGIYGPGRIPLAEKLRQGQPLTVPRDGYLNLVHVSDIARMLHILVQRPMRRSAYVFSDGQPVLRETFYRHLAQLCGVNDPVFGPPAVHDAQARRATDKRIDPSRIVTETNFVYQFPDFQSGLASALGPTGGSLS